MSAPTREQVAAQLRAVNEICGVIIETVWASGEMGVPQGTLYAVLMGVVNLDQFNTMVEVCIKSGRIKKGDMPFHLVPDRTVEQLQAEKKASE